MNDTTFSYAGVLAERAAWNRRLYVFFKRVIDLAVCLVILPIAAIVMLGIALAVKLDSPGPVFFVQERIGRGGKRFRIYKFRTMRHNHDDRADRAFMQAFISGKVVQTEMPTRPRYKPDNYGSITRLGYILRKTSLDEIPQIINVFRGNMSLVGPRPHVPWEVDAYKWWHEERLWALPGITGLAQIKGRSDLSFDLMARYDIEYVRNQSLALDLNILRWTVMSVLFGRGAG
jgi:lipopolysaccharide/colanic/teichoic acid biosynthesis glycosyltransferase